MSQARHIRKIKIFSDIGIGFPAEPNSPDLLQDEITQFLSSVYLTRFMVYDQSQVCTFAKQINSPDFETEITSSAEIPPPPFRTEVDYPNKQNRAR